MTQKRLTQDGDYIQTTQSAQVKSRQFDASILAGVVAESTIKQYELHFRTYLDYAVTFEDATNPTTLARWRQHLFETGYTARNGDTKQYSVNAINQRLAAIRAMMGIAAEQGYVSRELATDFKSVRGLKSKANRSRKKDNARTKITREQMKALTDAPDRTTAAGAMHYALLMTLRYSGFRISEIVGIKRDDFNYITNDDGVSGWCCEILGKNMDAPECREVGAFAYDAIQQWLSIRDRLGIESDYVFTSFSGRGSRNPSPKPISRQGAWDMVQRYAKLAGLADIKPHDFRRYVGTQLAKKDVRIAQKQLGHKRIETTVQNYVLDDVAIGNVDAL